MTFIEPNWPAPKKIRAFTTTRQAWFANDYLNLSEHSSKIEQLLHLPEAPIWLKQAHTTTALEALPSNRDQIADASFSDHQNHICAVLTADCLPMLVCNQAATHVAAIHAGWRGLANGVVENTLQALDQPPQDLMIWLGPAIGPKQFEVGQDVFDAFVSQHPDNASAFTAIKAKKWLANLYQLATLRLHRLGVTQIYGGEHCTYTEENLFYSYRRDHGNTGRMVSLIWINDIILSK